jgi:protein TonB
VASVASGGKGGGDAAGNAAVSKYPGLVQQRLRRALRFPKGAGGAQGEVQVQFVISASGGASNISVVRSSGHAVFDEAAVATVRRAAPFPPIPPAAGKSSWTMVVPLAFQR